MANSPQSPSKGKDESEYTGTPLGEYVVTVSGHSYTMKLVRYRASKDGKPVLQVISSSKWYRQTGHRWCGFATYDPDNHTLFVWLKFRGNQKRQRPWDSLAKAFNEQVIAPAMAKLNQSINDAGD